MTVTMRVVMIATLMALPLILTGCETSPNTQLDWGTKHARARATVKPKPQRYATYEPKRHCTYDSYDGYDNYDSYNDTRGCVPVPTARPRYTEYQPTQRWTKAETQPASDPDANFIWPVRGRVVENFGIGAGGQRNDGINIVAPEGTPILAAADGTVSYSGNEVRSYGNLMLLRHDTGYVTAYAHADHFVVAKGEYVSKGQIIGYVGATGDVDSPQLHFELRKGMRGEQPVNPRPYLGPLQVAAR